MRASVPFLGCFDAVADRYEASRGGPERGALVAAAIAPWLPPGGLVVDVGAGTGVVAAGLAAAGFPVVAVDLSAAMLARGHDRLGGRAVQADAAALPVRSAAAAGVVFVWCLHLVGDRAGALAEAAGALRPGGRVVTVSGGPQAVGGDDLDVVDACLAALRPDRGDDRATLAALAGAAGLRPVEATTVDVAYDRSPAEAAELVEQRVYAPLWGVPATRWAEVVEPALDRLRSLPDPDRRRRRVGRHDLLVFER